MFAIQTDREWRRFCAHVLDSASLADDPRFVTNELRVDNRAQLESMIEKRFARRSRDDLLRALAKADIPTASVNDVPAVAAHPQLAARKRWSQVHTTGGDVPALVPPHNLAGAPPRMDRVPALGEHTAEVLRSLEP